MTERHLAPLELAKTALSLLQDGSDSEDEVLALSLVTSAVALHLLKKTQTEAVSKDNNFIEEDRQSRSPSPEPMNSVMVKMSPEFEIRQEADPETSLVHEKADDSTISGAPVNDIKIEVTSADDMSQPEAGEANHTEDSNTSQVKRKRQWSKFEDDRRRVLLRLSPNDSMEQFCAEPKITDYMSIFLDSLKMDISTFNLLLSLVRKDIEHQNTCMRMAVSAEQRLALVLRYLSAGDTYMSIERTLKISKAFLCVNLPTLCKVLWVNLKDKYIKQPSCEGEWASKAEEFDSRWQFPLCLGVLTRRQFKLKPQRFANVMTMVDANNTFMHVSLEKKKDEHFTQNNVPPAQYIGNNRLLPYVFIANTGFDLDEHIMTPYTHMDTPTREIFNARLKSSTQAADGAFRILVERFKILQSPLTVLHAEDAIRACLVLHNFLMQHNPDLYATIDDQDDSKCIPEVESSDDPYPMNPNAEFIREEFAELFANEGLLPTFDIKLLEGV